MHTDSKFVLLAYVSVDSEFYMIVIIHPFHQPQGGRETSFMGGVSGPLDHLGAEDLKPPPFATGGRDHL